MKQKKIMLTSFTISLILMLIFSVSASGYSSAFEGPKARFYGAKYRPEGSNNDLYYTDSAYHSASLHRFDSVFKFDSDASSSGKPNIIGEQTSVFIPEETLSYYSNWVPSDWLDDHEYVHNPVGVHEWEIDDNLYYMEQWILRYYVTFSAEWNGNEEPSKIAFSNLNIYENLECWLELDISPTWYIDGGGTAYFAVGKIQLAHNALYGAQDADNNNVDIRNLVSVSPESTNSLVYLYYSPFGGDRAESSVYTYKNKIINPDFFTDKMYFSIDFNNFGVQSGQDLFFFWWTKGDTVTLAFDVTVFVIGEWTVQDIENDPDAYGRLTRQSYDLEGIIDLVTGWFNSPYGWIIMLVIAFILILVFAPWLLFLLLGGGKK